MMASHNRRETTVRCLSSLISQAGIDSDFSLRVSLVDSGSSDGTLDEVRRLFPEVITASASSDVFWGTGMRLASQLAADRRSTYHLWLNDDVTLTPDALRGLLAVAEDAGSSGAEGRLVVVGQLSDEAGRPTYGGMRIERPPLRLKPIGPVDRVSPCDTMNGNVVLVATPLHQLLGSIDPAFPHGLGDVDFGLRARGLGATVLQAPGFIGTCARHEPRRHSQNPLRRLRERASMKQLPVRPWLTFCRRHGGVLYPLLFVKPYLLALLGRPAVADRPDQRNSRRCRTRSAKAVRR
jgi:GT2 family glycosyltransferase